MDTEQDHDMDLSDGSLDGSLGGSRSPTHAMTEDLFTKKEIRSILEIMPKGAQLEYDWMDVQMSHYNELSDIEAADELTKEMNTFLKSWNKVNEESAYQQTAASNTTKSLKRPRSPEGEGETTRPEFEEQSTQDPTVKDAETRVDKIFGPRPLSKRRVH
jgi:DNA primase